MSQNNENKRRRRHTNGERRIDVVKFCAFWGIAFAALVMFVNFIISLLSLVGVTFSKLDTINGVLNMLSMVALLIAVAFPAYSYISGKGRNWRIFYWVVLIMYICGLVGLGIGLI